MSHGVVSGVTPTSPATPSEVRRFELAPRCSLTPRAARALVGTFAAGTFTIAGFFTLQGFWPVLPFAGLEIALLAWAVRASMRQGGERETLVVDEDYVTVQRLTARGSHSSVFPRHWVRVKLHAPLAALHPSRLMLESHGRACEVGRFLTEEERRSLAARLQQVVGKMNESPALR